MRVKGRSSVAIWQLPSFRLERRFLFNLLTSALWQSIGVKRAPQFHQRVDSLKEVRSASIDDIHYLNRGGYCHELRDGSPNMSPLLEDLSLAHGSSW